MFLDDLILNLMRARVVTVRVRVRMISDHGAREKSRISTLRVVIVNVSGGGPGRRREPVR